MSVSADHRRKGVGAALIGGASEWARWAGVEKLTLMVFPHNEVAIKFYEANGFVREGLRRRHAKMAYGYEDLAEMSLFLD
jgi:putative acetyltransferase